MRDIYFVIVEMEDNQSLRQSYVADLKAASTLFDTTLITISSGLLIYGSGYLKNIIVCHKHIYILLAGLGISAINILIIVISFFISEENHLLGIKEFDNKNKVKKYYIWIKEGKYEEYGKSRESIEKGIKELEEEIKESKKKIKNRNTTLKWIKKSNIGLLIIGTICIAYFIYITI